jgi:hypothetical protein
MTATTPITTPANTLADSPRTEALPRESFFHRVAAIVAPTPRLNARPRSQGCPLLGASQKQEVRPRYSLLAHASQTAAAPAASTTASNSALGDRPTKSPAETTTSSPMAIKKPTLRRSTIPRANLIARFLLTPRLRPIRSSYIAGSSSVTRCDSSCGNTFLTHPARVPRCVFRWLEQHRSRVTQRARSAAAVRRSTRHSVPWVGLAP